MMVGSRSQNASELGVAHFSVIDLAPDTFARMAAQAGFSVIGLRLNPAFAGAPYYSLAEGSSRARAFKAVADGEGIEVFDIEFFVMDENFKAAAHEATVASAAYLGARRLSVCGDDGDATRLHDNFLEFCTLAAKYGLSVDIENMGWRKVRTFNDSVALVNACQAGNCGILVDGVHFFRNDASFDAYRANVHKIKHVQLCDVRGPVPQTPDAMIAEARAGRFAPGDGDLPLRELVSLAADTARFSVEVPLVGTEDPQSHLKHLHDSAMRILMPDH